MEAGAEFGIKPFGIRAMTAMAVEKSYRLIPREMSIEYSAWESGLDRFVRLDKGDFLGREALARLKEEGPKWTFVTLEVHGVTDADARGNEAIHKDGRLVGRATHGTYGWRVGKSLALAMVKPEVAAEGTGMEITILGKAHKATVIAESPYDPENAALRADG
jgi:dimethylglycine dehydrogenase